MMSFGKLLLPGSNDYGGCWGKDGLLKRAQAEIEELGGTLTIPLQVDLQSALYLAGALQLALRHPQLPDEARFIARMIVDGIRDTLKAAGYVAHAGFVELGDRGEYDTHERD